jgi:hypothetical protein
MLLLFIHFSIVI